MSMMPPPGMGAPTSEFGPSAAGQPNAPPNGAGPSPMPAPPQPPPQNAMTLLQGVLDVRDAVKRIAQVNAASVPECQQIMDLVDKIQMKALQGQPPAEPGAPPV